ncbi:RNA-dependent RNA polymerase [viral metagenome]|uniref:RNA-dependent RNA polymerase n=1 Tax=viral metagenome TaxID=1070528 RepID=A0A6L2ZKP0_9ZZZZ
MTTVFSVLDREPVLWERELWAVNAGHPEWSAAAIVLGLNCMPPSVLAWLVERRIQQLPLNIWRTELKPFMDAIRRCPRLVNCTASPVEVLSLRKMLNCTWRDKTEADWEEQERVRMHEPAVHMALLPNGLLSRNAWRQMMDTELHELAMRVIGQQTDGVQQPGLLEWWDSRWAWAPSGSTSNRHLFAGLIASDDRLDTGARAGKKAAFEEMDDAAVLRVLLSPPIDVARASTKPEPGGKQRPLFASDDENFMVASYASLNIEKFMNVDGIVGKQTPADVAEWAVRSHNLQLGTTWLSLDYSAYNEGHELIDLYTLNMALGRAWLTAGPATRASLERALCCRWVARAHMNAWISRDGVLKRAISGLFSGHRNTARDNSLLHGAYAKVATRCALYVDECAASLYAAYCGDDEDAEFTDWIAALHYYVIHRLCGHEMKPSKQMAGRQHEFLQRVFVPGEHPLRPLWAMLAQTASGNWYSDTFIWYEMAIPAVSDNCWGLHVRGMPLVWARRLAVETLNAMMRTPSPTDAGWDKLEWWKYRNGKQPHPLWHGLGNECHIPPALVEKVPPGVGASGRATDAWIRKQRRRFTLQDPLRWDEYRRECMTESYNKLYTRVRVDQQATKAKTDWPARESAIPLCDFAIGELQPISAHRLYDMCAAQPGDRRPVSTDELAARFGVDAKLLQLIGGFHEMLTQLAPHEASLYENPLEERQIDLRLYKTDDALTSWAKNTAAVVTYYKPIPHPLPLPKLGMSLQTAPTLHVMLAPNLAGKTTYVHDRSGVLDGDLLLLEHEGWRQRLRLTRKWPWAQDAAMMSQAVWNACVRRQANTIVWQVGLSTWLAPRSHRAFDVLVTLVDPGIAELIRRGLNRCWSPEMTAKRYQRWLDGVAPAKWRHLLTAAEASKTKKLTSFG